ncbi:Protein HGH1-like protein [Microtus ochrogaster]|uniref:Protein HGH1 homolog n=1 Tax=Microtus ochrogaster TaxID=79684 RepID=A0A8J6L8K0_MICOH|nr:Protein HGH1-like protein [Microtus ochrogaster]
MPRAQAGPAPFSWVLGFGLVATTSALQGGRVVALVEGTETETAGGMPGLGVGSGLSGERGLLVQEAGVDTEAADLLPFLKPGVRAELQAVAAQHVLALTGSDSGRALLAGQAELLRALADLAVAPAPAPSRDASRALVNLAADPGLHRQLLAADTELPARLLSCVLDPLWPWAEEAAAVLANLSRELAPCAALMEKLMVSETERLGLERLVNALCTPSYNAAAPLHYLGPLLSNLSQQAEVRAFLLDQDRCVVQRLLPLTQYPDSSVRRGGVVGTLRNCCFEHGLPVDLQYLPPDKQREPDADIRKMLIEAIMLLTATAPGRQQIRDQGAYLVLRELHNWEPEPDVRIACEKLIQVLIGDEPEVGMDNLLEVQVPEDVERQLQQLDRQEQLELAQELRDKGAPLT